MLGELRREEVERLLGEQMIGRIGCHAGGRTYIVPVTYAYDGESVYGHATEGMKLRMMRDNPAVCFEVEHLDGMSQWQTVVAWGTYEELRGEEAARARDLLNERLAPASPSETAKPAQGAEALREEAGGGEAVLYRIRLTEKTGRFEGR